jgi:ketosteroid isomerase-like protein
MSDPVSVLDAAQRRADALVAADAAKLRLLMHPDLRWTTHRGDVLDRESYIDGNTNGTLRWLSQRLEDPDVVLVGDAAILTAVVVDIVERDGSQQQFRMRLTQAWVRHGSDWVCLAGHAGPAI